MKDDEVLSRIVKYIEYSGLSPSAFARKIGYNQSNLSKVLRGVWGIPPNLIMQMINKTDVSRTWLLSGEGSMLREDEAVEFNPNKHVGVRLVGQYAYAGYLSGWADDEYMETLPIVDFTPDREMTGNYLAFEVRGDSMDDGSKQSYVEGEIVICREVEKDYWVNSALFFNKRDFVVVHKDGILIKRIIAHDVENHTITIHSLNPMYPDKVIDLCEVIKIFSIVESRIQRRR